VYVSFYILSHTLKICLYLYTFLIFCPFFKDYQLIKSDHGRPDGSCGYDHGGVFLFVSFHMRQYLCLFVYFFVQAGWEATCRRRKPQKVTGISRGSISAGSLSRPLLYEIWVYRMLHDVKLHSFRSFRSFRLALHWAGTFWPKSTNQQVRSLALKFDKVILIPTKDGSMGDKILVVDDELLIREVLTEYLTGQGYEVIQASSG